MITKNVFAKGPLVIPKTIRELLGINVGDEIAIEVENEKLILTKKKNMAHVFSEVCERNSTKISMKKIKRELETRYGED